MITNNRLPPIDILDTNKINLTPQGDGLFPAVLCLNKCKTGTKLSK
jgi:hypothetical protein